ncbi:dermonecrotic toxin domain-containing protein [Herbaspirillum sp. alder98]|uniref:dermonecrotic toxin domain-containing protein n=1 Tax=Herbaspirillum sp. alder98 TaxID=2913096 RepID=UPI001CD84082|nr:DUF6543 domain-containing protein [Herbaspirillum sp. alder98]MCA1326118.1 hypothetical protein [Herbaspirillum sp. alder98]
MRIPFNVSPGNATPPNRQAARSGANDSRSPATVQQPAARVSLSQNGLEASRKSISRADEAYLEPAQRSIRKNTGPTGAAPASGNPGHILSLQRRLLKEHPDLRDESRLAIEARLLHDHGLHLDADHIYFNTFLGAHSSSETYNGWAHEEAPVISLSLTELQMRNFPADLGEDPNGLNANSGVYTEGSSGKSFGTGNEVRLLSTDLKRAVRANDVGGTYREKLKTWWNRNEQAVATLYQAQVRKWRRHGGLSQEACTMLREVLRAADGKSVKGNVTAQVFDINSYPSKDMAWLKDPGGRVVLIMPGNAQPLREYRNVDGMRKAIEEMTKTQQGRAELASHFSLYNRKDGATYQGVEKWLGDIAGGGYRARIAYAPQRIDGNLFRDQAARTRAAELDDIKRLVKSNSEVIEEESTQFVRVLGQLFPEFFLPAKATELALEVHQAVAAGASEDRQRAAHEAINAGINLAVAAALGALATPIRRSGTAAAGAGERSAYFNPPGRVGGGRIGYLLGPSEAPRPPSIFDDMLDQANEATAANDMTIDWDDESFTLSPTPSRSHSPSTETASESGRASPASGRSSASSFGPHRGSWAPGQERVSSEPPGVPAPPSSPITPLPGFGTIGNHEGMPYFNALGWIERRDMQQVFRAVPFEVLAEHSPEIEGFVPDMTVTGEDGTVIEDRYLLALETQEGAIDFGNVTYGAGNFAVFRIDADGVPAMPYRLNINYDMWSAARPVAAAREAGHPVTPDMPWLSSYVHANPPAPGAVPEGYEPLGADDIEIYERGHVFIDGSAVHANQIHRVM